LGSTTITQRPFEWNEGDLHQLAPEGAVVDSSPSGDDVFVLTSQPMVPQDQDSAPDMYDFRIEGGFPYFPPEPCDPLTEGSCQGTPPTPPAPGADPASGSFGGPGNPPTSPTKKPHKKHHKKKKHHRKSHKRANSNRGGAK
jgi:hypothetical protein